MVTSSNINQKTSLITSKGFSTSLCAKKGKERNRPLRPFMNELTDSLNDIALHCKRSTLKPFQQTDCLKEDLARKR